MPHEKFEDRLHEVLDARGRPESDPFLQRESEQSPGAAEELALYEALLDGLDARQIPDPPANLADRVLVQVERKSPPASTWIWAGAALAVAATLLLVLLPQWLGPGNPNPAGGETAANVPPALQRQDIVVADSPEPLLLDEYAMLRLTGEAMQAVRTTVVMTDDNLVIEGMRPVASSVSAALDALRGTLPRKSLDSKSSSWLPRPNHALA